MSDLTDWLFAISWAYFRPTEIDAPAAQWTTEDDPLCPITGTDDERIAFLLKTKSVAARFGAPGKLTFADYWYCNVDKLAAAHPQDPNSKSGLPYDASSADLSFVNHLAFGFANNCEAIERVMLRADCLLHRQKWDDRPDYRRATILKAVAVPKRWKSRRTAALPAPKPISQPAPPPPPQVAALTVTLESGQQIAIPPPPSKIMPALPVMVANEKGKLAPTLDYVRRQLETDGQLSFDDFRSEPMLLRGVVPMPMSDKDYIDLRTAFEREKGFEPVAKDIMRDAVLAESQRRRFDSGIEWLESLKWDGIARVDNFMVTYCGAADNEYSRAVSRYMWSGLAGRTMEPGCQLDMVIALQSRQGTKKSTGLAALAPHPDYFTDGLSLQADDDNFKRLLKKKVIVEIAEMAGLSKGDINVVKRAITRRYEEWVEKYQTTVTRYPRRCMLFASTNEKEFLPPDETGHRRWLPVEIIELDRDAITRDRDQLWAEGLAIWRAAGVQYADAERLAANRHKKYEVIDVWELRIAEWLVATPPNGAPPPCMRPLAVSEVLEGAVRMQPSQMTQAAQKRVAQVLRQLGYEAKSVIIAGSVVRRWFLNVPPPP